VDQFSPDRDGDLHRRAAFSRSLGADRFRQQLASWSSEADLPSRPSCADASFFAPGGPPEIVLPLGGEAS